MPTPMLKSFAEKSGKDLSTVEKKWDEAKASVKKSHPDWKEDEKFYAATTAILKNMLGLNEDAPAAASASTVTGDIAIKPSLLGGEVEKRPTVEPDGNYSGFPYFEVDSGDFVGASKARKLGTRYNIGNEKVRNFLKQSNYRKPFLLKYGDHYTKIDRGY